MIQLDVQRVEDFEAAYATVLDALDALKALSVPTEETVLEWHEKFREILARVPPIEDDEPLTHFAEQVAEALGAIGRSSGGAQTESEKRYPRDEGMVIPPETIFPVILAKDDGVAGDVDNPCTYTYTVKDMAENVLETTVTPEQARTPTGAYYYAGEGGRSTYGIACRTIDWTLKLLSVPGEVEKTVDCTEV